MDNKSMNNADAEALYYRNLQKDLQAESRMSNVLLIALTLGFVFLMAVLFWVLPDKAFSEEENRTLAQKPEFSAENLFSGKITEDFSDYMADQFPIRDFFVGIKAAGESAQLKMQNNSVIFGKDGYLIKRNDYPDENNLSENIKSAKVFTDKLKEKDILPVVAFAGRKQDVTEEKIPSKYGLYYGDLIWQKTEKIAKEEKLDFINLRNTLREIEKSGEELYYKTDHHWNSLGAYFAYCEFIQEFGETPYPLASFEKETVTDSFFGTTYSSSGAKWVRGDTIDYYRWDGDENFKMLVLDESHRLKNYGADYENKNGAEYACFNSYFVRDFLRQKDKYASFIGGNFGYTEICHENESRETLLIIKDSFSHSTVQFLARHYNLIMIDLRYYKKPLVKLCEEKNIKKVLLLYNMETLTEASYLSVLRSGLK